MTSKTSMEKFDIKNKIYAIIFSISIIIFIIIASFFIQCLFLEDNLINLIKKFDTVKNLPFNITEMDLEKICKELIDYLSCKTRFLETKITINGNITDFYSLRSKIHMGDVRNIFEKLIFASYFCIIICIFSLFKIISNKKQISKKNILKKNYTNIYLLKKTYTKTIMIFIISFVIIIYFAILDFDNFFTIFHKILFTNDLWLLNPNEDYIICLLPEKIFMEYGIKIIINIFLFIGFLYVLLFALFHLSKTQQPLGAR